MTDPGRDRPVGGATRPAAPVEWERTLALLAIVGSMIVFLAVLAVMPAFNPTFDDAKYIGMGRNVLAGIGPTTVFGVLFLNHSPLWPVAMAGPERLTGIDALTVGHALDAVSGAVVIALGAALGWRVRPLAGAIAAISLVAFVYLGDLARTAGIDLPAAAFTLGYLLVGLAAARRGSIGLGIAAGLLFALAFLTKETALPWAPAPFLAAIFWTTSWVRLAKVTGWALGVAAVALSWWFAVYAVNAGAVYRLGTPAWTLVPLAAVVAIVAILLAGSERLARGRVGRAVEATVGRTPATLRPHARAIAGWGLTAAWTLLLVVVFWRTPKLLGAGLLDLGQLTSFATHLLSSVKIAVGLAAVGWLLAFIGWRRGAIPVSPLRDDLIAVICGLPLVLLVAGIGETPRHYVVDVVVALALGAAGWAWFLLAIARGLGGTSLRRRSVVLATMLGIVFVGAAGMLTVHAEAAYLERDRLEEAAAGSARAWLRDHVRPGDTVAFGPYLGYEIALDLPAGVRAVSIRPRLMTVDPTAPLGLRSGTERPTDVVSLDVAPGKSNQFNVWTAGQLQGASTAGSVDYVVYPVSEANSATGILDVLTGDPGARLVGSWKQAGTADTVDVLIYQVDPEGLRPGATRMVVTPEALDRLTTALEARAAVAHEAAAGLLDRVVTGDPALDPILARLKIVAGR